jgi:hypothetical protein
MKKLRKIMQLFDINRILTPNMGKISRFMSDAEFGFRNTPQSHSLCTVYVIYIPLYI